jgi:hypothetical protein
MRITNFCPHPFESLVWQTGCSNKRNIQSTLPLVSAIPKNEFAVRTTRAVFPAAIDFLDLSPSSCGFVTDGSHKRVDHLSVASVVCCDVDFSTSRKTLQLCDTGLSSAEKFPDVLQRQHE